MKYKLKYKPILLIAVIGIAMMFAAPSLAADVKAGSVINAKNIDEMKSQTFEGKTIGSMLPDKIEWWIRNHNLEITLANNKPYAVDPAWVEATNKYSGDVKLDPKTRIITGYKAGMPFPNITDDDPQKGEKLIWNMYCNGGWPRPSFQHLPAFRYLFIDGNRGLEQTQTWTYEKVFMTGNLLEEGGPVLGDGSVLFKNLIMALEPFDIRGVGSFKIRYMDGRADDAWVYARSVRRTRRLSGGGWFDPIGGTDQLNDEVSMYSAFPSWYPSYKYIERRTILAVAHARGDGWDPANDTYPHIDLKNPPYFNPINDWEPREVFVIEATMPDEHIYSKRIYYLDVESFIPFQMEAYDKKGEFVKIGIDLQMPEYGLDGTIGVLDPELYFVDWKRMHATCVMWGPQVNGVRNPPLKSDEISVSMMEALAQQRYKAPIFPAPDLATFKPVYFKDLGVNWSTRKLK